MSRDTLDKPNMTQTEKRNHLKSRDYLASQTPMIQTRVNLERKVEVNVGP